MRMVRVVYATLVSGHRTVVTVVRLYTVAVFVSVVLTAALMVLTRVTRTRAAVLILIILFV